MCSNLTWSFHLPLCRLLLFIPQNMCHIHLLRTVWILSCSLLPSFLTSTRLMHLCKYTVIPPDYVNFNIHGRGNILTANSNRRQRKVLGAFASSRGASVSFVTSVVFHHVSGGSHSTDFLETWYWRVTWTSVEKMKIGWSQAKISDTTWRYNYVLLLSGT